MTNHTKVSIKPWLLAACTYLAAPGVLQSAPVHAPTSIDYCAEPLLLHLRRPASDQQGRDNEIFELCGATARTEFAPVPDLKDDPQAQLLAHGIVLELTRTAVGMRVQLKLGANVAEALELRSNAAEQAVRWSDAGQNQPAPPQLRMRVERRPSAGGISKQFKILKINQPVDQVVKELVEFGQLDVSGLALLCQEKLTVNFEAIAAGVVLGFAADLCAVPMEAPAHGRFLRFVRKSASSKAPNFENLEAELKFSASMAKPGDSLRLSAEEALLQLAERAREQRNFAAARGYLAKLRRLPRSWFGMRGSSIDIAQARVEVQAGQHKKAQRLLIKILRSLDQSDPDQISEERADALLVQAQLYAAQREHAQAITAARSAYAVHEQLQVSDGFYERQKSILELLEDCYAALRTL